MAEDIDIGLIIKKAFKSIIHDPGYITLFLLPMLISVVFGVIMWFLLDIDFQALTQASSDPTLLASVLQNNLWSLVGIGIFYIVVISVVSVTVHAATIKKVEAQEKGDKLSVSEAFSAALPMFPRLFGATFLFGLLIVLPILGLVGLMFFGIAANSTPLICLSSGLLILLFIPLIYFVIRLCLFSQTCVVENLGSVGCLKQSWKITKGNVILLFVTGLLLAIIAFAVMVPFIAINSAMTYSSISFDQLSSGTINSNPIGSLANFIGQLLVQLFITPVSLITLTLVYFGLVKKHKNI